MTRNATQEPSAADEPSTGPVSLEEKQQLGSDLLAFQRELVNLPNFRLEPGRGDSPATETPLLSRTNSVPNLADGHNAGEETASSRMGALVMGADAMVGRACGRASPGPNMTVVAATALTVAEVSAREIGGFQEVREDFREDLEFCAQRSKIYVYLGHNISIDVG